MKETTDIEKGFIGAGCVLSAALLAGTGVMLYYLSLTYSDAHSLAFLRCLPNVPVIADALSAFSSQTHAISPHFGLGPDPATPLYKTVVQDPIGYIEVAENMCKRMAINAGLDGVGNALRNIADSILSVLR